MYFYWRIGLMGLIAPSTVCLHGAREAVVVRLVPRVVLDREWRSRTASRWRGERGAGP